MGRFALAAVVLMSILLRPAAAQSGDGPRVPRAITDAQLQKYCDRLSVSDDQRHAVELEFERYLDDFEPLRLEMAGAAVRNPAMSRTDVELVRQLPSFIERTRAADESLFTRIEPLLTDDQLALMPRIRMQRERALLCGNQTIRNIIGDGAPDLRALLESLNPSPEIMQPLAGLLDDYEVRLTAGIRKMFEAMMRLCASDAASEWMNRGSPQTPTPAWTADVDRVIQTVRDRALNRRFFESTAPSLPEDLRRRWRDEFVLYAYGSASEPTRMWALTTIDAALRSDLADDQRQAVMGLRDEACRAQDETLLSLMELLDREAIAAAGPMGARGSQEFLDALNGARRTADTKAFAIRKSLQALLGQDRLKQLESQSRTTGDPRYANGGWRSFYGLVSNTSRVITRSASPGVPATRTIALLAWPLERAEFDLWLAALEIEGEARTRIDKSFAEYEASLNAPVKRLQEEAFRNSPSVGQREPPKDPLERAKAAEKARAEMRSVIDAADAQLYAGIRDALGERLDQAMWDRLLRLRSRALMGMDVSWMTRSQPNGSGAIDLIQFLLQQRLSGEEWATISEVAAAYEGQLEPLMRQQLESIAKTTFQTIAYRDGWRPDDTFFRDDEGQQMRYRAIGDLNCSSLRAIIALLPPTAAGRVEDAFNRKAYPKAFDDDMNMDSALRQALELKDLTPGQREQVASVRVAFDESYQAALRQLVETCAGALPYMPMASRRITEDVARADEQFNEEFARLTDAREEANRWALRGLRVALLPPQMRLLTLPQMNDD